MCKVHLLRLSVALLAGLLTALALTAVYAVGVEPRWLAVRAVCLAGSPSMRLIHITDLHYKGDRAYLERIVRRLNLISADLICFTGDLTEDPAYLDEAIGLLSQVHKPMYGVRGNHDCLNPAELDRLKTCFAATGGRWLTDERVSVLDGRLEVFASTGRLRLITPAPPGAPGRRLLLVHDPMVVEHVQDVRFDLILAGHTHGGQIRLPGCGALLNLPFVDRYECGLYQTSTGPLYVNPGLGTFWLPVRLGCRPEITVIEL